MTTTEHQQRMARREQLWGTPVPAHLKHHRSSRARNIYGCACILCLPSGRRTWRLDETKSGPKSAKQRTKDYQDRLRNQPVPETVAHGGSLAAKRYRCPCELCRKYRADERNRYRKPAESRKRTRGHWSEGTNEHGSPINIIWWPPATYGQPGGLTPADCSLANCQHVDHREAS